MKKKAWVIVACICCLFLGGAYWYFSKENYCVCIPVKFSTSAHTPHIDVEIEGVLYPLLVDTGAGGQLYLQSHTLEKLNKTPCGTVFWTNAQGKEYEVNNYVVPMIKIQTGVLKNIQVREEPVDHLLHGGTLWASWEMTDQEKLDEKIGSIGQGILTTTNFLFDFPHNVMYACSHLSNLKREGYQVDRFLNVPFEMTATGIVLKVETDLGPKRLLLDTGATFSLLKASELKDQPLKEEAPGLKAYPNSKSIIGGHNFGPLPFYYFESMQLFDDIDGILGMDFLRKHAFYLDYGRSMLSISIN